MPYRIQDRPPSIYKLNWEFIIKNVNCVIYLTNKCFLKAMTPYSYATVHVISKLCILFPENSLKRSYLINYRGNINHASTLCKKDTTLCTKQVTDSELNLSENNLPLL